MKNRIDLNVEAREAGKSVSRALRNSRRVPAIIYGSLEPVNVSLHEGDILRYNVRAYENALFNLKSSDGKTNGKVVLMKSVDVHPVTRRPQHVDLFALDLTKPVRVYVEVRLEGKPAGLAEGGLLNVVHRQLEVECLPNDIPEFLTAEISHLGVGDALHVSDVKTPANVKMIAKGEDTVAVVNVQAEETVAPAATADAAAAPAAGAAAAPAAGAAAAAPAKDAKAPAAKK
jgi:large subunit ribosomal protein L25